MEIGVAERGAEFGHFRLAQAGRPLVRPVLGGRMRLDDLVGVDLVAAVQHQVERRLGVPFGQAAPHQVPLGRVAVLVALLHAVTGEVGDAEIAFAVGVHRVARALERVPGGGARWQREQVAPCDVASGPGQPLGDDGAVSGRQLTRGFAVRPDDERR